MLDSSCRLNPVKVPQPLAHNSLLWWVLLAVTVCRSIFLSSFLAYDLTFWACDFCLQQVLPSRVRFWARWCGTQTSWLVLLTSLDWVYCGGLGNLLLLMSWSSLISVYFEESKVLAWALLVQSRPVSCLCVCHSNTLGIPSEGEMYRVSSRIWKPLCVCQKLALVWVESTTLC